MKYKKHQKFLGATLCALTFWLLPSLSSAAITTSEKRPNATQALFLGMGFGWHRWAQASDADYYWAGGETLRVGASWPHWRISSDVSRMEHDTGGDNLRVRERAWQWTNWASYRQPVTNSIYLYGGPGLGVEWTSVQVTLPSLQSQQTFRGRGQWQGGLSAGAHFDFSAVLSAEAEIRWLTHLRFPKSEANGALYLVYTI